jgi:aspartyl protease family protein
MSAVLVAMGLPLLAGATEVAVAGLFPGKALLVIDGGRPTLVAPGKQVGGVRVVSVKGEIVVVEVDGERRELRLGERVVRSDAGGGDASIARLRADGRGHFVTLGSVNGSAIRFLVDTGASMVSIGRSDAERAGIDFIRNGRPSASMTANGIVRTWVVKLNTVQVAGVTLHNVDAAVHDSELPLALLGMSFLNRMEMLRDGDTLTLKRRY